MSNARELVINVMREVQGVAKRETNTHQNFNFRGIDAVVNAIGPALRKHGGFIVPKVNSAIYESMKTQRGGDLTSVRLQVRFEIWGSEGDPITGLVCAEAFDSGDKATAKAMSVAYRTFMLQTFCLPTDEPDPDTYTYEGVVQGAAQIADPVDGVPAPDEVIEKIGKTQSVQVLKKIWEEATEKGYARDVQELINERKKKLEGM